MNRRDFLLLTTATTAASCFDHLTIAADNAPVEAAHGFQPIRIPDWVRGVTRMAFVTPGEIDRAAELGVQVCHGNAVWPYYPLRRDGGGLKESDRALLQEIVERCHKHGMKYVLGLPPFPSVECMKAHPDWRVHTDDSDAALKIEPKEDNLGTRLGCNNGPWGDFLIDQCVELMQDFGLDGYSFDGNYHPPICFCPACKTTYRALGAGLPTPPTRPTEGLPDGSGRDDLKGDLRSNPRRGQETRAERRIPPRANLDDVAYREYLVWRGEQLEQHYAKLQQRLKVANPNAVVMTWTVNAGRYGHFLHSPRAMPTRMNQLFDLPMQEWWQDETNFGASVAPAFGAAYIRAVAGDRPAASEAYLMSRGNPYGTDSFPKHERITRNLHAMTNGCVCAEALGWTGHRESVVAAFDVVKHREAFLTHTEPLPWAALLVSEQTRQFYAYRDIADRFLPHVFGTFRVAMEEHFPLALINDWDVADVSRIPALGAGLPTPPIRPTAGLPESGQRNKSKVGDLRSDKRRGQETRAERPSELSEFKVLILAGAAALSDEQCVAIREFVRTGGGLVATGETSHCDELGRPRKDFALADLLGVSYRGRPAATEQRETLDTNFAITVDDNYWKQRVGVATLTWPEFVVPPSGGMSPIDRLKAELQTDLKLRELVPTRSVTFKGPQVLVTEPKPEEVIARMTPAGWKDAPIPAVIARTFGTGRVVYLPACLDAAMWSYSYPYQRRMLTRLIEWAAGGNGKSFPIEIEAPMCVQTTFWRQRRLGLRPDQSQIENLPHDRLILHFFNGLNTTANHGFPAVDVPLREETVPIHGIKVHLREHAIRQAFIEPGHISAKLTPGPNGPIIELPPLEIHQMLVIE